MNKRYSICFDFESDGLPKKIEDKEIKTLLKESLDNKKSEKKLVQSVHFGKFRHVNPVQLAACVIDLNNCQIEPNSEFNVVICPDELTELGSEKYYDLIKERGGKDNSIDWHAREVLKCTPQEVIADWEKGISEKQAWKDFCEYCDEYTLSDKWEDFPIAGGQNILGFDLPLVEKMCTKFKTAYPFAVKETFDLLNFSVPWFYYSDKPPINHKMETLRTIKAFGLTEDNQHDALKDCTDTAKVLCKFLSLKKELIQNIKALKDLETND